MAPTAEATPGRLSRHVWHLQRLGEWARVADPGSVDERWRVAGGSLARALPQDTELQLGRDLGVGALVSGTAVQGDSTIMLAASMVDVKSGETRVPTVRVEGPGASPGQLYELADQLIVLLLSRDRGVSSADAERLRQYKPGAIQAYLAGFRAEFASPEQKRLFRSALAADSNLVEAALLTYSRGENPRDSAELRYAWEHQDQLSERGRAYVQVLAAGKQNRSIRSISEQIAAYEALANRWPEWAGAWQELGEKLTKFGARAGISDWRRRARDALEHIEQPWSNVLFPLTELAFMDRDTARARRYVDLLAAQPEWLASDVPSYRWRLAILEGDMAAAAAALAEAPDSSLVLPFAVADGNGVSDADRVVDRGATLDQFLPLDNWLWARGRDPEWRDAWQRAAPQRPGSLSRFAIPIFRAILLGELEDSVVLGAIRELGRIADGGEGTAYSPEDQALARCWVTFWRLERGDTTDVRATLRYLAAEPDRAFEFAGWARLIEALLAGIEGDDVHAMLLRADSLIREFRFGSGQLSIEAQNLTLARLLREYGEPERALAATRRRVYQSPMLLDQTSISEYLREEARLAAEVGDTTGAVEAYRHYFALRDPRPEHPRWAAQWDSMRVEYEALTGVEGR